MKKIFILFIFFISYQSQAKFTPLMLSELIDKSNVIGYGEIIEVNQRQIKFKFEGFLKGSSKSEIISINKFEDWTCASRYTPYKNGQKELIFLKYSKNKTCEILGSGNEGEMPIHLNNLYYKSPYQYFEKSATTYKLNNGELSGYLYNFSDVKIGVSEYLSNRNLYHKMGREKTKKNVIIKNHFFNRLLFELKTQIYMSL